MEVIMRKRVILDPIESIRELKFKFFKEANYTTNRYTRQIRRATKQLLHKQKMEPKII